MSADWVPTRNTLPPKDTLIEWISADGSVERGRYVGGALFKIEDSELYTFPPSSWRLVQEEVQP